MQNMKLQEIFLERYGHPILVKLIQTKALETLSSEVVLSCETNGGEHALPVKMTCFVPSREAKTTLRHTVKSNEKLSAIPVTVVVQPPLGVYGVLALVWYISEIPAKKTYNNNCMAVELKNGNQWLFIAQDIDAGETTTIEADETACEKSAERSLTALFNNLEHFDFNFHDLLHTWYYIPQITGYSNQKERYQIFNKYRKEIFAKQSDPGHPVAFFPASTGIGCDNVCIRTSAVAFRSNAPVSSHAMENGHQVPAYEYPQQESIEPPLFSRGMCLLSKKSAMIFVSGTASILDAKTVCENDIAGQTHQTIKNIHGLLLQNAIKHGLTSPVKIGESIQYATVYIKQEADFPVVKEICRKFFGNIPILFVKADICRSNLLVEIECICCMYTNQV